MINIDKSVLVPTQELEFLGYGVNTVNVPWSAKVKLSTVAVGEVEL